MDEFVILGDLSERADGVYVNGRRRYIVRMFVGEATFDEELELDAGDDVAAKVTARIRQLAKKPQRELRVDAARPDEHPGHAISLPEADA